jgi:hypothetical protein
VALTIGVVLFVAVASARLTGAIGEGQSPQRISFDCDPSQLEGALKALCLAKRFEEGRRLFEEETFGGNGRTCATCHSARTGPFSAADARRRLAKDPGDPLFVHDGLDHGLQGTTRITEHATVRIEIPLTSRVRLLNDPAATSVVFLRGTPTTINTPSLQFSRQLRKVARGSRGAVHVHVRELFGHHTHETG